MSGSIVKKGANTIAKYVIVAFLTVVIMEVMTFFRIAEDSIPIKILVTFISLILAVVLLRLATQDRNPMIR